MKKIREGLAIFLTIINFIGTIAITALILYLELSEGYIILLINLIPLIFCIVLIIDFCVDECCKVFESLKCDPNNWNCSTPGTEIGPLIVILIICFFIIFVLSILFMIFLFFYVFTKGMGKHVSRFYSLWAIIFFEIGISLYSLFLFFDEEKKCIIIFAISSCLALFDLFGILFTICPCSCSCCCSNDEEEDDENDENYEIYENDQNEIDTTDSLFKSELSVKNTVLRNDFEPTSNENNLEEKNNNPPIDNITRPNNNCNDEIKRVESDYSNAPLPID